VIPAWKPYRAELEPLPASLDLVEIAAGQVLDPPALDAEVIVLADETRYLARELASFKSLRFVQTVFAGLEELLPNVPQGVIVSNASGVHDSSVSEWVMMAVLASLRRLPRQLADQARGFWDHPGGERADGTPRTDAEELEGKALLIVGYGSIGRALERRLEPFGVRVTGVTRHARPGVRTVDELPVLLPEHDIVVILAPLTDETRGMVDAGFLGRMHDDALLVNAARGGLVDQPALLAELRSGRLHAALDVTEPEPLPEGDPLWSAPNCIITPHAAGTTRQWMARAFRFVGDQLRRYASGEPLLNVRTEY
jgi:phosphoglycerate dehydrogenase-like enzyme